MTQLADHTTAGTTSVETADLASAIQKVLQSSEEPLTISKIKAQLPAALRTQNIEEAVQRLASAKTIIEYPKYRSPHARYWDRPMPTHITFLLRQTLQDGSMPWSELRRKLPAYAVEQGAENLLQEQVTQGKLFRHPKLGSRGGERFGVGKADPKDYLRGELVTAFGRLQQLGFTQEQLRAGALELLHEEEWATVPAAAPKAEKPAKPETAPEPANPS